MMIGIGIGITAMRAGGGSAPSLYDQVLAELFGNGEQGIYMPSVHESFLRGDLYQDAAGTTPVTAAGQSVGLWLDRSGNGNYASQSTAASRPALQQDANGVYVLRFDGSNDSMGVAAFSGTDTVHLFAAIAGTNAGTGSWATLLEYGTNTTSQPPSVGLSNRGNLENQAGYRVDTAASGQTGYNQSAVFGVDAMNGTPNVLVFSVDSNFTGRQNGGQIFSWARSGPALDYEGAQPVAIGNSARGSGGTFSGDMYGLIICASPKSVGQIEMAEALIIEYMNRDVDESLLMETGDALLLESGDKILLED